MTEFPMQDALHCRFKSRCMAVEGVVVGGKIGVLVELPYHIPYQLFALINAN